MPNPRTDGKTFSHASNRSGRTTTLAPQTSRIPSTTPSGIRCTPSTASLAVSNAAGPALSRRDRAAQRNCRPVRRELRGSARVGGAGWSGRSVLHGAAGAAAGLDTDSRRRACRRWSARSRRITFRSTLTRGEEFRPLTAADVPAMVELAELTEPGPFRERTIELGPFFGIFESGRLLAMAGQRTHLPHSSK